MAGKSEKKTPESEAQPQAAAPKVKAAKRINVDLAPGVRAALKLLLEKENNSTEQTKVTLTYTDVVNEALAKYFQA
jgi:hypothetical protein